MYELRNPSALSPWGPRFGMESGQLLRNPSMCCTLGPWPLAPFIGWRWVRYAKSLPSLKKANTASDLSSSRLYGSLAFPTEVSGLFITPKGMPDPSQHHCLICRSWNLSLRAARPGCPCGTHSARARGAGGTNTWQRLKEPLRENNRMLLQHGKKRSRLP